MDAPAGGLRRRRLALLPSRRRLLYSRHALHTYAAFPGLQIGPPAIALAGPLTAIGDSGRWLAELLMAAAAPVVLWRLERNAVAGAVASRGNAELRTLVAGLLIAPTWGTLAVGTTHLDDVLVIAFAVAAILAHREGRDGLAAVLLGLAAASKPWAVGLLALPLGTPGQARLRLTVAAAAVPAGSWLPFLVGDRGTLHALASVHLGVSPDSLLSLCCTESPAWVRPAQFLLALTRIFQ